ncbi:MAG: hypothetical protein MJ137_02910 [Clostridia bacterium]|nr:hypothetical protein [Clostridia bacterium]
MNQNKRIAISDATLKHCGSYTFREKLEAVRLLGKIGVDAVEFGAITENDKSAALLCRTAAALLENCVLNVEITDAASADAAVSALSVASHPRLTVSLPLSTVQAEYTYHKKPAVMVKTVGEVVKYAAGICPDVVFRAVDVTRAEAAVTDAAVNAAIEAGAHGIVLCDIAGETLPGEIAELVSHVKEVAGERASVGVEISDKLGMAVACAVSAVSAGADSVSCSAFPGSVSITSFADAVTARGADIGACTGIDSTVLKHTAARITELGASGNGRTPFEDGVRTAELGDVPADADIAAVGNAVKLLGYDLNDDDKLRVFDSFKRLTEKSGKTVVTGREIDAIVASTALQVPPTYKLESYVINSGNKIAATAIVTLTKGEEQLTGLSAGDGPIDAAFLVIEQIIGHHYELDDFQIQSVTEGREAMGDALVRLRANGALYSAKGLSTDIIGASIRAYVNALNKIVYGNN